MLSGRGLVPRRILLVEDDVDISATLCEMLEDEGYQVFAVPNGRAALDSLERVPAPVLVLLDVEMPRMDGYDFLQHLRADPRHGEDPVVVVTASRRTPPEAAEVLRKPFDFDVLLEAVERHCGAPSGWRTGLGAELHAH